MVAPLDLFDTSTWPRRPLLMGIVNVTPDSFSDGGLSFRWERAVGHALRLIDEGADSLDIGGESTRPGSDSVSIEVELKRVLPVIRALVGETDVPISVDTRRAVVAAAALDAGAILVNDVSGLRDPGMAKTIADRAAGVCIMHMQGEPKTMQADPHYDDVVAEVSHSLGRQAEHALESGIEAHRIWLDPGIGFGKKLEHNLDLLASLDRIAALGYPVLVGASRKHFIGMISGEPVELRLGGRLAAIDRTQQLPHAVVRVHDVAATRQFLQVSTRITQARAARLQPALEGDEAASA